MNVSTEVFTNIAGGQTVHQQTVRQQIGWSWAMAEGVRCTKHSLCDEDTADMAVDVLWTVCWSVQLARFNYVPPLVVQSSWRSNLQHSLFHASGFDVGLCILSWFFGSFPYLIL